MQHRFLSFTVAMVLALTPALADTTTSLNPTTTVNPANTQTVNPQTTQNAQTANVSTQINNENLGANGYGPGIQCQAPQIALGGYGARQSSGVGLPNSDTGVTVQYLTPVGTQATHTCNALASEIVRQRQLDTQLTTIQKCADFARAGIVLDPQVYPELARSCSGIRLSSSPAGGYPPTSEQRTPGGYGVVPAAAAGRQSSYIAPVAAPAAPQAAPKSTIHLSDFSPAHNSELRRIAMHRLARIVALRGVVQHHSGRVAKSVSIALQHENEHLRAIIAEEDLENSFLRHIATDKSWRGHTGLRERILSYNAPQSN